MTKSIGYKIGPTWREHVALVARVQALEDQKIKNQPIDDDRLAEDKDENTRLHGQSARPASA